jgi:hypothetical protein
MTSAKFKLNMDVVGKIRMNMGWTGTIIAIIPTDKTPKFRVRWTRGGETVVGARAIRLPGDVAVANVVQFANQAAPAPRAPQSGSEEETESDSDDEDEEEGGGSVAM